MTTPLAIDYQTPLSTQFADQSLELCDCIYGPDRGLYMVNKARRHDAVAEDRFIALISGALPSEVWS